MCVVADDWKAHVKLFVLVFMELAMKARIQWVDGAMFLGE
ncbi:MAG TPA: osmotically inducible protein OsmC, partial [Pseudomonas sp.]|nr:osmotically inducible protein OsmC [Pseudomonas sp.]